MTNLIEFDNFYKVISYFIYLRTRNILTDKFDKNVSMCQDPAYIQSTIDELGNVKLTGKPITSKELFKKIIKFAYDIDINFTSVVSNKYDINIISPKFEVIKKEKLKEFDINTDIDIDGYELAKMLVSSGKSPKEIKAIYKKLYDTDIHIDESGNININKYVVLDCEQSIIDSMPFDHGKKIKFENHTDKMELDFLENME